MIVPAHWPRDEGDAQRMLVVGAATASLADARVEALPRVLGRGDVLVVNDAATMPAALPGRTPKGGAIEVRLFGAPEGTRAQVALLGAGDLRARTEDRPAPPVVAPGDVLVFGEGLRARVDWARGHEAAVTFDREGAALWSALYRAGRVVQYAHVRAPLALWQVQTAFASRPWAAEEPSAARPLTWATLLALAGAGVTLARVTHAAGLSSVDGGAFDRALPRPEAFDVPDETVSAIAKARAQGGRIVAVGTSVVRALEGNASCNGGELAAMQGTTSLVIDASHVLRVVTAVLSGIHEPGTSHFRLLEAFASRGLLERAHAHAEQQGYLGHELGDSCLILRDD